MRPETSEALARLVSIYVALIERAGIDINDANVNRIMTDPFAACESLNELAVKVGALDAEADAVIAAIYESMDAADARSAADEACLAMVASAWETTHVEHPVPEPEPEPEPQAADGPKDAELPDEAEDKPKRRRPKAKKAEGKDAAENPEEAADGQGAREQEQGTPQEAPVDTKPGRRSRAKAKTERKGEGKDAEKVPKAKRKRVKKADEPASEQGVKEQTASDADPATEPLSNAAAAKAESLSVDQAVAILGVSRPTVYKLIESGELPAYKKGRSWRISAEAVSKRAAN